MATRHCVMLICTDPRNAEANDGHDPSVSPRHYGESDREHGRKIPTWPPDVEQATVLRNAEARSAVSRLRADGWEPDFERLVVEDFDAEMDRQRHKRQRKGTQ